MKRMIYINFGYLHYFNKTLAQLKSFRNFDYETYLIYIDNNKLIFNKVMENNKTKIIETHDLYFNEKEKYKRNQQIIQIINNILQKNKYEIIYIRRIGIQIIFYRKFLKTNQEKSKIVYEIPTYPFDKLNNLKGNIYQFIEKIILLKLFKKYIDVIPVILQKNIKLEKNMLRITNGVDYDRYNKYTREKNKNNNSIEMVSVAHLNHWHGYDRLIYGIKNYKGNYDVKFTLIGDYTDTTLQLMELVKELNLENKIKFIEYKNLSESMKQFDYFDIAIGSLAYHRRGADYDTSIKNKEYCAAGIPFITSCYDLSFPKEFKYLYKIDSTDEPVKINDIIKWYKKIEKNDYIIEMKKYAKNNLTFDEEIKKIIKKCGETSENKNV